MESDGVNREETAHAGTAAKGTYQHALPLGTRLGEFEIERVLGQGGFSFVYLALDHSLKRQVAIKEYLPGEYAMRCDGATVAPRSDDRQAVFEAGLRSFIEEARLLAQFEHPALVKVFRFWEANGTAYMAMPYYQGRTLREILKSDPAFANEATLKALVAPLLDAVALLHAQKWYHRDISPDNIIVQPNGAPVLLDFGAARRIIGDMSQALTVVLKPGYAPIEQYAESGGPPQGPWTDVYAFAAVLYAAVTGKPPVAAVGRAYTDTLVPLQSNPPPGYSLPFLCAIDAGLAVRPEDRPQSIAAFREALGLTGDQDNERTIIVPRARPTEPVHETPPQRPVRATPSPQTPHETLAQPVRVPPPQQTAQETLPQPGRETPSPQPSRARWPMLAIGVAGVALIPLGVLAYLKLFAGPQDAKPVVAAVAPAPSRDGTNAAPSSPPRDVAIAPAPKSARAVDGMATADPREAVKRALSSLECARISFELGEAGRVTVNGQVQNVGQQAELERRLRNIAGVTSVQANLAYVPRPYCDVTALVEGIRSAPGGTMQVRIISPPPPLKIGQGPVILEVSGPDFAANVAVDVWSPNEKDPTRLDVSHLLPHARYSLSDRFVAKERKRIEHYADDGKKVEDITVLPPAGRLLITAIASDRPLVQRTRPSEANDARAYIASVRRAAQGRGANVRVATWYGFVEVLP